MEWLLIIVLMLLIISPVMWLRPTPRQKRLVRLRDVAIKAGVKVKLEKPPLHDVTTSMPCYRWTYPPQHPGPRFLLVRSAEASASLKEFRPGWRWRIEPLRPLPEAVDYRLGELLTRLPQDALVIESDRNALTLWWWESQGGERFASYLDDFGFLCQQLAGRPDQPAPRQVGFGE